jgi:hypothetical protein
LSSRESPLVEEMVGKLCVLGSLLSSQKRQRPLNKGA